MKFKTTWFPVDGSDPTEEEHDSLAEIAAAITDHPEWAIQARGFYIDWVDDGGE